MDGRNCKRCDATYASKKVGRCILEECDETSYWFGFETGEWEGR